MRLLTPLCCLGAALLLTSCAGLPQSRFLQVPVLPPTGGIYAQYKAPLMVNLDKSSATTTKIGKSTTRFIRIPIYPMLSVAFDDASIEAAAKEGGITKVHYADYELMMVLGVYGEITTIVYGD